jgi:hypothetical protein
MAWDSSRPVPWRRLVREWLVYVTIMAVGFGLAFRDRPVIGIIAGLLLSGPLYIGLGYALAKLGHQRKSLRQARADAISTRAERGAGGSKAGSTSGPRPRPAATKRTGAGNQRANSRPRR